MTPTPDRATTHDTAPDGAGGGVCSTRPRASHPLAQRAGILSNDPQFRAFAARRCGVAVPFQPTAAAEYIRTFCRIASRRDLDTDLRAARDFQILLTEYDLARGRIAQPR